MELPDGVNPKQPSPYSVVGEASLRTVFALFTSAILPGRAWAGIRTSSGAFVWRFVDRTQTVGDAVIARASPDNSPFPAGEMHTSAFHTLATCFHIEFGGTWRHRLLGDAGIVPEPQEFLVGRVPMLAGQMYQEFLQSDRCSPLVIEGLAYELMGWSARETQRTRNRPQWLIDARDLVHDRFNKSLTLTQIAEHVGVHPVHLAREFKRAFGWTVREYVRRLRVDFVSRHLSSGAPLSDLALQSGFADQSHLTRVFKRITGQTPRRLRAMETRK